MVWTKSQGCIIREIVVDQARWESDDLWEAIDCLSSFATLAYQQGGLRADEIAPEVLWNSQVTYYYGQVRNNGHYLYVSNSGWKAQNIAACRSGLAACGVTEIADIYHDLAKLVPQVGYDIPEWFSHYDSFRKSSPLRHDFDSLNDRLYGVDHDSFLRRRIEWIKSLPNFEVVPTEAMHNRLEQLFAANPLRAERCEALAEKRQQGYSDAREAFRGKYKKLREQSKTDFPCFVAMFLGTMNDLYLMHFSPCKLVDDPDMFNAGFYDENNQQIIQLLVLSGGDYGLLNLNLENGLGEKNERVSESNLRMLWERWRAEG